MRRWTITDPAEQDTGGANAAWISEDASLIILGGDTEQSDGEQLQTSLALPPPSSSLTPVALPAVSLAFNWPLAGGIFGGVIVVGLVIMVLARRKAR